MYFLFRTVVGFKAASPEELADQLDSRDLLTWQADFSLSPWGELRSDYQTAMIVQQQANLNRKPKSPPISIMEVMPRFDGIAGAPRRKAPDWREHQAYLIGLTKAMGGKVAV